VPEQQIDPSSNEIKRKFLIIQFFDTHIAGSSIIYVLINSKIKLG
jgi:hypothetical protein